MPFELKNVAEVPPPAAGHPRKYPYATMAVGQMFFIAGAKNTSIQSHASTQGSKLGRKFATRQQWMRRTAHGWEAAQETESDAVQGVGVYRTE